jgi:hypothetical protein
MKLSARIESSSGDPITVGSVRVTPQAAALVIRAPFGSFVWNRPTAILAEQGGHTKRILILDIVRLVQLGAFAIVLAAGLGLILEKRRSRRNWTEGS